MPVSTSRGMLQLVAQAAQNLGRVADQQHVGGLRQEAPVELDQVMGHLLEEQHRAIAGTED